MLGLPKLLSDILVNFQELVILFSDPSSEFVLFICKGRTKIVYIFQKKCSVIKLRLAWH